MVNINWIDIKDRTDSYKSNLPDVITPDHGVGLIFKDDGGIEYTTVLYSLPREIRVSVTSFRGISFGAMHYYARISVSEPSLKFIDEHGEPQQHSISGAFDRFKPEEAKDFDIEVYRPITATELEDDDRWHGYKAGDLVHAFETEEELYEHIVSLIKARFSGDWMVDIDGFYDSPMRENNREIKLADL